LCCLSCLALLYDVLSNLVAHVSRDWREHIQTRRREAKIKTLQGAEGLGVRLGLGLRQVERQAGKEDTSGEEIKIKTASDSRTRADLIVSDVGRMGEAGEFLAKMSSLGLVPRSAV
jgi:hypothetical protein